MVSCTSCTTNECKQSEVRHPALISHCSHTRTHTHSWAAVHALSTVVCVYLFFLLSSSCFWVCWFYPPPTQMFVQLLANKTSVITSKAPPLYSWCFGVSRFSFCAASIRPVFFWSRVAAHSEVVQNEEGGSVSSARNSVSLFKLPVCALSRVLCLFSAQYNVTHQYTSTQPHPVKDNLNVNIIQVLFWEKPALFVFLCVPMLFSSENTSHAFGMHEKWSWFWSL